MADTQLRTHEHGAADGGPWYRRPAGWAWFAIAATALLFATLAWRRRWMSDDGLIVLRTVRNLYEGHGAVYNAGERVEANTSTLWTFVVWLFGLIPGTALEWVAIVTGLVCAVGGLVLAMDGARRLHHADGAPRFVVPAGALLVCALPPFRDFATSGLETGLISLWLGGAWWLVVRRATGATERSWPVALVLGLGPLVRPDLALFSAVGFAALCFVAWRGPLRAVAWLAVAGALPLAYQVFRMGYYGLLTPNTAVAKEASAAHWDRGLQYLADLGAPYYLWVPVLLLAGAFALLARRLPRTRVSLVLVAFPLLAGAVLALYVIRIGGDFMHGRMLLPALFVALLPVMAVPVTRWTGLLAAGVGAWAVVAGLWLRVPYDTEARHYDPATGIADERGYWSAASGLAHPVRGDDYAVVMGLGEAASIRRELPSSLVIADHGKWLRYPSATPADTFVVGSIGALGVVTPPEVRVHDVYGLVSPLAAHSELSRSGRSGHEKNLPPAWNVADGASSGEGTLPADQIAAARVALQCPEIREMLDSVRAPLTASRFWDNLTGAFPRTALRYPADPREVVCR
ncbi:hypothetical protein ACWEVP_16450 [Amycolatopsis sp. NPDC003865]